MAREDHELAFLLSLDGLEFQFARGYVVKIAVREIGTTKSRPHGIKYSLTLHDPAGRRIYGMDNAHGVRRRTEYDHRHVYGASKMVHTSTTGQRRCCRTSIAKWSGYCRSVVCNEP